MIKADQHTHCNFSTDSDATAQSMVHGAIEKGLTHLCLTDHMDLDYPGTTKEKPLFEFNPADYFASLMAIRYGREEKTLPDIITAVPSHRRKAAKRGFDHSFLLAQKVGERLGIEPSRLLKKLEANKKKPMKKSGFMARLEEAQRQQQKAMREQMKKNR